MKKLRFASVSSAVLLCFATALFLSAPVPSQAQAPISNHVVLVIDENHTFASVLNGGMPWLVSEGNAYGYANNYFSNSAGSLLDYLWLASGSCHGSRTVQPTADCTLPPGTNNFHCTGNDCYVPGSNPPVKDAITDNNIFREMNNLAIPWKVYALNYLNAGGNVNAKDSARGTHYYARHNGAVWYAEILNNTLGSQGGVVDFEQFPIDVANGTLPRFSIIVPDGVYDAHDGSLKQADDFLKNNLSTMLSQSDFQAGGSGLLLVTFDECGGGTNTCSPTNAQVYTALIGPNIKPHTVSNTLYHHPDALRTMLDSLGITTYPGAASTSIDMSDFFTANAGGVAVNSPANNSTQGTLVPVNALASELGTQIHDMEIWDNGTKLGNFTSPINQTFTLAPGKHQMTIQDIGPGPNYAVLHKEIVNFTVSANNGVFFKTPADGSTQAPLFPLNAYAVESSAQVDHLEIWQNGNKLGDSPLGSSVSQWYNGLAAGSHQLTVNAIAKGTGAILSTAHANITVSTANGVYVNSPAANSTQGTSVHVNAYAYEQGGGSTQLVDHMEVWDNGTKLGNSPVGYGQTSLFIDQTYTLASGSHQMTIEDVSPSATVIHKTVVNFTIP